MYPPTDPRDRGPDPYERATDRALVATLLLAALPVVLLHPGLRLALALTPVALLAVRRVRSD
jgi:hypothetical protein